MNIDLGKTIALVTGGAGQLGRVMVRTLAACGANVANHYRSSAAKAEELEREINRVRSITLRASQLFR
jgi:3-oxoacyl-[acyl-carrier protein] reductase